MITSNSIKANGLVNVWDVEEGRFIEMAPVDAAHALQADAKRYALSAPVKEEASAQVEDDEPTDEGDD